MAFSNVSRLPVALLAAGCMSGAFAQDIEECSIAGADTVAALQAELAKARKQ